MRKENFEMSEKSQEVLKKLENMERLLRYLVTEPEEVEEAAKKAGKEICEGESCIDCINEDRRSCLKFFHRVQEKNEKLDSLRKGIPYSQEQLFEMPLPQLRMLATDIFKIPRDLQPNRVRIVEGVLKAQRVN